MADESRLEVVNKSALLESDKKDSGIHQMLSEAYHWASEHKTEVAIGATLVAIGGAALLRKTLLAGEATLPELAIGNTDKLAVGTTEGKSFWRDASIRFGTGEENPVIRHELSNELRPLREFPRELDEDDFNTDGSLKILRFLALEPDTAPVFREAEALNLNMGGDSWGEALITTIGQRSPKDLPLIKAGLEQVGMLPTH